MNGTWVKLYHVLLDSSVMQDDWHFRLFVWCLLKANYKEAGFRGQIVKPGQFITGRSIGADALNVSPSKFYRGLQTLQDKYESIKLEANNTWTTVTVCNWHLYQFDARESEQPMNSQRTTDEQRMNNERTAGEHNLREIEGQSDKGTEPKKKREPKPKTVFVPPCVNDVAAYCAERKNQVDAQNFVDFYESKGWMVGKSKMVDWKSSVRTWEKTNGINDRPGNPKHVRTSGRFVGDRAEQDVAGLIVEREEAT